MIAVNYEKEVEPWQERYRHAPLEEILLWADQTFGPQLIVAASMGAEDMALIAALASLTLHPRVLCLDTGLLFPETLALILQVERQYSISVERIHPNLTVGEQGRLYGERLWESDPDLCCYMRKTLPLSRELRGASAWVTGIRREQSASRKHCEVVQWDPQFSLVKINPLAYWSADAVWDYIRGHNVPYNPWHDRGFPSIGCLPCTQEAVGDDPRSGRWAGRSKTECGLHRG